MIEVHFKNKDCLTIDISSKTFYELWVKASKQSNPENKSHFLWIEGENIVAFDIYEVCYIRVKNK